jgi:HK97 family phage prohead protease
MNRFHVELRAAEVVGNTLAGHAAVFGQAAEIRGGYEAVAPGAFAEVLQRGDDVAALRDHNPSLLLGRTSAGTLRLEEDKDGLAFEVDLPDTSYARDLRELVRRGDLAGGSFGFIPGAVTPAVAPDGRQLRTHTSLRRLLDVSVVTYPAYDGTDVTLRHLTFDRPPLDRRTQIILARHRARILPRR